MKKELNKKELKTTNGGVGTVAIGEKTVSRFNDKDVTVKLEGRDVAMVFQSYALYPHLDVLAKDVAAIDEHIHMKRLAKGTIKRKRDIR